MLARYVENMVKSAKEASRRLAVLDDRTRNAVLRAMAGTLRSEGRRVLRENAKDIRAAKAKRLSAAMIDRLALNRSRVREMADGVEKVARLPDPVGRVWDIAKRPNGLVIAKTSVPIGVILMIYESRPNVTSDCVALCLKSGNSSILRGGSEAIRSNIAIFESLRKAADRFAIPRGAMNLVTRTGRAVVEGLLRQNSFIDLVIPRGGESLIKTVASVSRIPVIKHYKGVCHTFVDWPCDIKMAEEICLNAKVQRPGVCNAMEKMLVHEKIAGKFLPPMVDKFRRHGVEIRGCPATRKIVRGVKAATEADWYEEYLDLILAVRIVSGVDEAIRRIAKYGSQHSDAIVTGDYSNAMKFLREVDSACVYVNASTRFTDGGQFGKGAEIGISTDRLHARGPMGLEELTTYKYIIVGSGQVRR